MRPKISIKSSNGFESDTIMETSRYTVGLSLIQLKVLFKSRIKNQKSMKDHKNTRIFSYKNFSNNKSFFLSFFSHFFYFLIIPFQLSDILPISRFTKKMSTSSVIQKPDNFNIEVVTEDDSDEVLRLLKKFFFKVS